jgi:hypothetical protein
LNNDYSYNYNYSYSYCNNNNNYNNYYYYNNNYYYYYYYYVPKAFSLRTLYSANRNTLKSFKSKVLLLFSVFRLSVSLRYANVWL